MMAKAGNPSPPEGFRYAADVLPQDEERELVARMASCR